MSNLELGKQQVIDFHINIQTWFNGTASNKEVLYKAIVNTFDPSFKMTNGDGNSVSYDAFTQWLPTVYGKFPTRQVEVKELKGYATFSHIIVEYIEIQQTEGIRTERESSAVFTLKDQQAIWYNLIERWV
ncbi:hypothetical protein [Myroides profundi]|uniref:Uncharacterized protein n=1 Tax=Myroides profundi TaxID=480520 RepID=A0AAJ4W4U2_MYRPR|nr:hypothetical protein [Myroides profundi]AJH15543.1 hypothetical protein MPR_2372 [Myroides profundi]SER07093.1 hypothetical protein SAMN04488089_10922 [Myroides profundi]